MKKKVGPILGWHYLVDYEGCDPKLLNSLLKLKSSLIKAAKEGNATVIKTVFHRFSPHGVSGVVVIAESHISIHTWPEFGYASIDVFSCTEKMKVAIVLRRIAMDLKPHRTTRMKVIRGRMAGKQKT